MKKWLSSFTTQDLIIIAIISALGLAVKPVISPIVQLISAPLLIPGGSLAGGFYMLWLALVIVLVPKKGSAIMTAFIQGVVTIILGYFGQHGVMSILTYTAPGIAAELVALLFRNKRSLSAQISICAGANLTGTLSVALLIMKLPTIPLIISLTTSAISGFGGGIVSYMIIKSLSLYGFELVKKANS